MTVRWTETALAELVAIDDYLARRSARYARAFLTRVFERTELLAAHPQFGAVVPEFDDDRLREVAEFPYRIIYRILDAHIDVVAVVHVGRRLPSSVGRR